jgi:hypothetical protein
VELWFFEISAIYYSPKISLFIIVFFERLEYIIVFFEKIVKEIITLDHKLKFCGPEVTNCVVEVAHTPDLSGPYPRQRRPAQL